jgi:hypothetical protein
MAGIIFVLNAHTCTCAGQHCPFTREELHLMGHCQPVWPIKVVVT